MPETKSSSLPIALNATSPIVLDEGWQSVAVLPQMFKWKHELPYITDDNQKKYWEHEFLDSKLKELTNDELVETTLNSGFLYIFCNGYLVTEYQVTASSNEAELATLHRIDLDTYAGCDERPALSESTYLIELLFKGGVEDKRYEIAYSEYQWPWLLINYYGGASENDDFDDFKNIFKIEKCQPGLITAAEDDRLVDYTEDKAAARRANRFTVISLTENTNLVNFDQEIKNSTLQISSVLPSDWTSAYPELNDQPDFNYPCYWVIHYTIFHAHTLALELVESFNITHTGLTSLIQGMSSPDERAQFPKGEHIETAILASQLYYSTPSNSKATTNWERDCNQVKITDKLSYKEIQEVLRGRERATYRNMLLILTKRLGVLLSEKQNPKYKWKTSLGDEVDTKYLHTQLIAYLNDFRASPLKPGLTEEDLTTEEAILSTAHDRWSAPGTLLSPFSVDPLELCLLFEGERQYHDSYIKNINSYSAIGPSIQSDILSGSHGISAICLPGFIDKVIDFKYEKLLTDFFNLKSPLEEKQNSQQAKDLYKQWQDVATYNQNKKAKKPKDLPYQGQLTQDGFAYGGLVFKAVSTFLTKFPKSIDGLASGKIKLSDLHIGYMTKLMALTPIGFKEGSMADLFEHTEISGGKRVDKAKRIQLIADFLEARQDADPDGRRKKKLKEIKHQQGNRKLSKATRKNFSIILTDTDADYKKFLKDSQYKKSVILNPADSKLWQENLQTRILLVDTPNTATYEQAINRHMTNAQISTAIGGVLMIADFYNLYTSINKLKTSTNPNGDAKLIFALFGQIAGTGNSAFGIVEQISKMQKVAQSSSNWAKVSRFLVGKDTGWKLSRYAFASKYLPVIGGVIGLSLSASDFFASLDKGDDVYIVHLMGAAGAAMSIVGVFYAGAILGPIGLGLAVLGLILSKYAFKQDNLLEEWLEHGVFSRANTNFMSITKYMRTWDPENIRSQSGIPPLLFEKDERFLLPDQWVPKPLLSIVIPDQNTHIVFDQNYCLIGVDQQGYHAVGTKMLVEMEQNTLYFGVQSIGTTGLVLGSSAHEIRQKITQLYQQHGGGQVIVDDSKRGQGGDWFGDDHKKFAEPFKKFPEANVEALLNASYPFNIKCHMYPATGYVNARSRDVNASGNNIAIVIDVPYFVENQSHIILELREDRGWGENRWEKEVVKFTEQGDYRLEIDTVAGLDTYDVKKHKKINSSIREHRVYKSEKDGIPQVVVIANIFPRQDIKGFDSYSANIEAWARLSINGTSETESTVQLESFTAKSVWMPFRSAEGWKDLSEGFTRKQSEYKGNLSNNAAYFSPDLDWAVCNAVDKARA